jgi:hypothetical protein
MPFCRKLRKCGLNNFLNRFTLELWNHRYIHTEKSRCRIKNWGKENKYGSCKDSRCGRTDRHDFVIRLFGAILWKKAKKKKQKTYTHKRKDKS